MHFSGFFNLSKRNEYPTVMKCSGQFLFNPRRGSSLYAINFPNHLMEHFRACRRIESGDYTDDEQRDRERYEASFHFPQPAGTMARNYSEGDGAEHMERRWRCTIRRGQ
jgi:hypothetical protein